MSAQKEIARMLAIMLLGLCWLAHPQRPLSAQDEQIDPLERRVSVDVQDVALGDVLRDVCRQAELQADIDAAALGEIGLNVDAAVTHSFSDLPLDEALQQLVKWQRFPGAYREVRKDRLIVSTLAAMQQHTLAKLPDWLQPHYSHGLLARVDDGGHVVDITVGEILTDELLAQLATLPHLQRLNIGSTTNITAAGLAHLAKMSALEELTLSSVNREGAGLGDDAVKAISNLQSLRELSINECGLTDDGARHLESLTQLTHLNVYQEGLLTDECLASIAKLARLQHLSLTSHVATVQYGRMLFSPDAMKQLASLNELKALHVTGQGFHADLLRPQLTSLSVGGSTVDDAIARQISECPELRHLSLTYTAITDEGLQHIGKLSKLRRLAIDSAVITDAGIGHLTSLPQLTSIDLRATQITDRSLQHLSQIESLVSVSLHGSGRPGAVVGRLITIPGVLQLKSLPALRGLSLTNLHADGSYLALRELEDLQQLTLLMTNIRADEMEQLQLALPDTVIHGMSGGFRVVK